MLFLLRKIRRSFFQPDKLRTYFAYAFGEIILIVMGILIAFNISNWGDRVGELQVIRGHLFALQADFKENLRQVDISIEEVQNRRDQAIELLELLSSEDPAVRSRRILNRLHNVFSLRYHRSIRKAYNEIINDSALSKIENAALKSALGDWERQLLHIANMEERFENYESAVIYPYKNENLQFREMIPQYIVGDIELPPGRFQTDIEKLANDNRLENILVSRFGQTSFMLLQYDELRETILKINQLLEEGLASD